MSDTITYVDGEWIPGNPPIIGPLTHAAWMASVVFDGARAFEGRTPDLDLHAERCVGSAAALGLRAPVDAATIVRLAREGMAHFPEGTALYIRPMIFAESGWVAPDPASTRFVLTLLKRPMPSPEDSLTACLSTRRRPSPETAPTDAKAACLYPNVGRTLAEAAERGFQSAVVLDLHGNVAEFATANLFLVKDGIVTTPVPNGTFLAGITRHRTIHLLREAGITVEERTVTVPELMAADEVFSTGNASKVQAVTRIEDRDLQPGPVTRQARDLYWRFAHAEG